MDGRHEHTTRMSSLLPCDSLLSHELLPIPQIGFSIGGIARRFLVQPPSMSEHRMSVGAMMTLNRETQFGRRTWSPVPSSTPSINNSIPVLVPAEVLVVNDSSSTLLRALARGTSSRDTSSKVRRSFRCRLFSRLMISRQALGYFNWVCWIVPNNVVVNQLFGYNTGLVRFYE